jgi:hypothetical protein
MERDRDRVHVRDDPGDVRRSREAADLQRSTRVARQLGFEMGEVDPTLGVLPDRDDVDARLPPRQLVRMVLVGTDEDDGPLGAGPGEVEQQDELADGAGRTRSAEDDDVVGGAVDGAVDDPAGVLGPWSAVRSPRPPCACSRTAEGPGRG